MTNHDRAPVTAEDLIRVVGVCTTALQQTDDADWSARAGDLDWDCRHTLDHLANVALFYAVHLASRATRRLPLPRNGDPTLALPELFSVVAGSANVLAEVARAAPPTARGFHPAGMADAEGFLAMACAEILVHTHDIARGLGLQDQPRPPADLVARVLARIFPWAPPAIAIEPWSAFLWVTGRAALPDRDRLDADWYWHCAPLVEWNGTVRRRSSPPAWT